MVNRTEPLPIEYTFGRITHFSHEDKHQTFGLFYKIRNSCYYIHQLALCVLISYGKMLLAPKLISQKLGRFQFSISMAHYTRPRVLAVEAPPKEDKFDGNPFMVRSTSVIIINQFMVRKL